MFTLLERAEALAAHPLLAAVLASLDAAMAEPPGDTSTPFDAEWVGSARFALSAPTPTAYADALGPALEAMRTTLGHAAACCLLADPVPWLHQPSDHPPVVAAHEGLWARGVGPGFDGGFRVAEAGLSDVGAVLFWLARCQASLPEVYVVFEGAPWLASLCKYGILHVEYYAADAPERVRMAARAAGFRPVDGPCGNLFDDAAPIEGRRLIV